MITRIDNIEIYSEVVGAQFDNGKVPYIVFLHDALGSVGQWKSFPAELSRLLQLPAYVYDRQGHGNSSALSTPNSFDYLLPEAHILNKLIDKLFAHREIIIFGHSDGGTLALLFAALYPSKLNAMIVEAPHVFLEPTTLNGFVVATSQFEHTLRPRLLKYHGNKTDRIFERWSTTWQNPANKDWNMFSLLETITTPVLLIQGESDDFGTENQLHHIAQRVKNKALIHLLPNCGHFPHHQQRKIVLELSAKFLEQTFAPTSY